MRLVPGDPGLSRRLALTTLLLLPCGLWWLQRHPQQLQTWAGPCRLESLCGVPCLTCGGTMALVELGRGRFLAALSANPLVTILTMAAAVWALGGLVMTLRPRWQRRIEAAPGDGRRLVVVLALLAMASWVWILLAGRL